MTALQNTICVMSSLRRTPAYASSANLTHIRDAAWLSSSHTDLSAKALTA